MIVRFFAFIRDYTGTKEISTEGCPDLKELLERLCTRYGARLRARIFAEDRLSDDIIIMVNGRHIEHLDGTDTKLGESDEISIFPRVAGG